MAEPAPRGETLFLAHAEVIERVVAYVARRHHLSPPEADELSSLVNLRLIESDYAIIRKFQGRSSFQTYLTTVIQRLFFDERRSRWGKWRPSAQARRLGPVAMRLESLVSREGLSFDEAFQTMRTNDGVALSREAVRQLAQRLPRRNGRRFVGEEALVNKVAGGMDAEREASRAEMEADIRKTEATLQKSLERLAPRDRLILKMRYQDSFTVSEIASVLREDAKRLYRRLENLHRDLRQSLQAEGVQSSRISELLGFPEMDMNIDLDVGKAPLESVS